jgi:diguanylate cyclase (GGDEF)-like protein
MKVQSEWFPDQNPNPVMRVAEDGRLLYGNPASEPILAVWRTRIGGALPEEQTALVQDAARSGKVREAEVTADDRVFMLIVTPIPEASVVHMYGVDITERKRFEEETLRRATHDALTDLPNRSLFLDRLEQSVHRAKRDAGMAAVLLLDLDHFREVNETLGHSAGDEALRATAQRLILCVGAADTVGRIAGARFGMVLERAETRQEVIAELAERVLSAVQRPMTVAGRQLDLSATLGISVYPMDDPRAGDLMRDAEIALHGAKAERRGSYRFYTATMGTDLRNRQAILGDLREALVREDLELHYQPQVELRTLRVVGLEALVRSRHPTRGPMAPAQFIPLAEEHGLIARIGEWVLRTACDQVRVWQESGSPDLQVAVNVSAIQFHSTELVQLVESVLKESGLDPRCLELEITEGITLHDAEATIDTLERLRALGVTLSVDDFGTGYSSLRYLKRFPVQKIKIDQSFVREVDTDPRGAAISEAVVNLAHRLQMRVLAEGVEREGELRCLQRIGCDEAQGHYFSRACPAEEITRLLSRGGVLPDA